MVTIEVQSPRNPRECATFHACRLNFELVEIADREERDWTYFSPTSPRAGKRSFEIARYPDRGRSIEASVEEAPGTAMRTLATIARRSLRASTSRTEGGMLDSAQMKKKIALI